MELQNKVDGMVQSNSAKMLLRHLIDYACLFPPARLSLSEAIRNYAAYIKSTDEWMLGSFIHPAATIHELEPYVGFFPDRELSISALGRKSENYDECLALFEEDLDTVVSFEKEHRDRGGITCFELPLPPSVPTVNDIKQFSAAISGHDMTLYCEVTFETGADWEEQVHSTLERFADHNRNCAKPAGNEAADRRDKTRHDPGTWPGCCIYCRVPRP